MAKFAASGSAASGVPGDFMTVSTDWKTPPVILLIGLRPGAASIVAMSIFFIVVIASIARFAAERSGSSVASSSTRRRDLPGEAPVILHVRSPHLPPMSVKAAPAGRYP